VIIKALIDHNYTSETKHVEKHNNIVQEGNPSTIDSVVVLNIIGGLEISAQQYPPKTSLTFPTWQYWLGIAKFKNASD